MWNFQLFQKRISRYLLGLGLLCLLTSAVAQDELIWPDTGLTNAELNNQKLFIEANKEKLLGAYDKAAELFQEVIQQDPANDAAYYELARVYEAKHASREALEAINHAIRISPENTWYYVMKGDILEGAEEYAAAAEVYETLISLSPAEGYYYEHLVDILRRTNQPEQALNVLDRQQQIEGVLPEIVFQKVEMFNVLGRTNEAVDALVQLVTVYPSNAEYLHRLANQCLTAGRKEEARQYYQEILRLDPDDGPARIALASESKRSGDDVSYLQSVAGLMANPAVDLDAKVIELIPYVEKFRAYQDQALGSELNKILGDLTMRYPAEAKVHAIYADFLWSKGELSSARREYEKTLTLDKSVFSVWEHLMYLKLELNDADGMLATSEEALDVFPNQAGIYYLRGLAKYRKMDAPGAAADLQQALIMSGRNAELQIEVLLLLSQVYQESGQREKAYEVLERALQVGAKDVRVLNGYAYLLALNGDSLEKARDLAARAIQIAPGNPDVEHTQAWIAFRTGDLTAARNFIEKSMDHGGGDDYRILEHYGDILITAEETDAAVEYWQLSLDRGNPSDTLKRKISERRMIH